MPAKLEIFRLVITIFLNNNLLDKVPGPKFLLLMF